MLGVYVLGLCNIHDQATGINSYLKAQQLKCPLHPMPLCLRQNTDFNNIITIE